MTQIVIQDDEVLYFLYKFAAKWYENVELYFNHFTYHRSYT